MKHLLLIFALVPLFSFAQIDNPDIIINNAKTVFEKIKDYEVDAKIKLDLDMVRMPQKKAKIYFKQPDKFKIDAKGFMMIHKKTMNLNIIDFLKGGYTALYIKKESINGFLCYVVKIIPKDEKSDNVLTNLWIDCEKYIIRKIENNSKTIGNFVVDMEYSNIQLNLPSMMKISFDAGKNQGIQMAAEMKVMGKRNEKSTRKGSVTIVYSNYIVNKGLVDKIFQQK